MYVNAWEADFNEPWIVDAYGNYFSDDFVTRYERSVLKSGKLGKRINSVPVAVCRLWKCDTCGRIGTKRRVRLFFHTGRYEYVGDMRRLCTGCWNRFRAVWKRQDEADECTYLINKIKRTIADERKNQNNRRT